MISTSKRDVSHSLVGEGQRTVRRRKHRLASVAVAAILAETLVVSGSVTAVSASTVHSNGVPSASSSAFREGFWPWGSTISLNPYSPDFVPFGNLALFGLAAFFDHNRPGANPYYPEIAQSWTVGSHQITLHLQPGCGVAGRHAAYQHGRGQQHARGRRRLQPGLGGPHGGLGSQRATRWWWTCSPGPSNRRCCSGCSSSTSSPPPVRGNFSRPTPSRTS